MIGSSGTRGASQHGAWRMRCTSSTSIIIHRTERVSRGMLGGAPALTDGKFKNPEMGKDEDDGFGGGMKPVRDM